MSITVLNLVYKDGQPANRPDTQTQLWRSHNDLKTTHFPLPPTLLTQITTWKAQHNVLHTSDYKVNIWPFILWTAQLLLSLYIIHFTPCNTHYKHFIPLTTYCVRTILFILNILHIHWIDATHLSIPTHNTPFATHCTTQYSAILYTLFTTQFRVLF